MECSGKESVSPSPHDGPPTSHGRRVGVIALDNYHFPGCSWSWAGGPAPPALPLRFQGLPGQGDSEMQKAGCHLKPQEELLPRGRAAGMLEGVSRYPM